jgi:hypothetical protein
MTSEILPILVFASIISVIAGCAATYQGNPKGRKWLCVIPLAAYVVVGLGAAAALGFMTGRRMIDVETSRQIFIGVLVLVTAFCSFFFFKYK